MLGGWRGPQTCGPVRFLQPTFRKRVVGGIYATLQKPKHLQCFGFGILEYSAIAPPSMSSSHIIPELLKYCLRKRFPASVTHLISVYILYPSDLPLHYLKTFSAYMLQSFFLPDTNLFHLILPVAFLLVDGWLTPTPFDKARPFHRGKGG